jgi:hypothetical protein
MNLSGFWRSPAGKHITRRRANPRAASLGCELLEDRVTPTLWLVPAANNADPAPLAPPAVFPASAVVQSLRQAIVNANENPGTGTEIIELEAATYNLTLQNSPNQENNALRGDLDISSTAHALVIRGQGTSGAGATIIDASGLNDRVFHIVSAGVHVIFQNLVITGGTARDSGTTGAAPFTTFSHGGGILNQGGAVTLQNVVLTNNQASGGLARLGIGGGLASSGATGVVVIAGSVIQGNTAQGGGGTVANGGFDGQGGGISLALGVLSITGSLVRGNIARGGDGADGSSSGSPGNGNGGGWGIGGGIRAVGGVHIAGTTLSGNLARGGNGGPGANSAGDGGQALGGGLYYEDSRPIILAGVTFHGNIAQGGDGADSISIDVTAPHIAGAGGDAEGGGAFLTIGTALFSTVVFTSNLALGGNGGDGFLTGGLPTGSGGDGGDAFGGGVLVGSVTLHINSANITSNLAQGGDGGAGPSSSQADAGAGSGGGIYDRGEGKVILLNSLVGLNNAANGTGGGTPPIPAPDYHGAVFASQNNLIGDGTGSTGFSKGAGDRVGITGQVTVKRGAITTVGVGTFRQTLTIANASGQSFALALSFLFKRRAGGKFKIVKTVQTKDANNNNQLEPGESVKVTVTFKARAKNKIRYNLFVFPG